MQRLFNSPIGTLVPTIQGHQAFVPSPLPREVTMSSHLVWVLDEASRAVANVNGVGETTQNPYMFIRPLLRREALLSSRIEGTFASLSDVFSHEAAPKRSASDDVREVVNYIMALELGIQSMEKLPISLRLVNQIHENLLTGVRGQEKRPGELRPGQVWIGAPGSLIQNARFIPPPPDRLRDLFLDWERFANEFLEMPPLVRCALMHYQFEAVHPYEDGNGRVGRLLIPLYLIAAKVLSLPLLYLSAYFERDRQRYYDELFNVSATGDWERWLDYFLTGVHQESLDVLGRLRRLRRLHDNYREVLQERRESSNAFQLLDKLFANPFMTIRGAKETLDISTAGARGILNRLAASGLVRLDNTRHPQLYVADEVLRALQDPVDPPVC